MIWEDEQVNMVNTSTLTADDAIGPPKCEDYPLTTGYLYSRLIYVFQERKR